MFRAVGFVAIPNNQNRPACEITVFRGATASRVRRPSWSGDLTTARSYRAGAALRAQQSANVYRAYVMPSDVLALFQRGSVESEVVVDPDALRDVSLFK